MSTIFISHSSADNALAEQLAARLKLQGHTSVFLDLDPEQGIVAGRSWERTLYRKLRACRAVIAICTDSYLQSQWCFAEIALARMEGKQILALLADPLSSNANLPSILTERQFIDLRRDPEESYRRLWRGLKDLDLLGLEGDWDPTKPPYLGLSAYHEQHAPVFFGREAEVQGGIELLDRGAPGLIMVLGASGSGKSSLARAGILPRLRRDPDRWIVVEPFRPGRDPFAELGEALGQTIRRYAPDTDVAARDARGLKERLAGWSEGARGGLLPLPSEAAEQSPVDDARLGRLISELEALKQQPSSVREPSLLEFLDWSLDDLRRIFGQTQAAGAATTPITAIADQLRRASGHPNARVLLVIDQFEELLGQGGAQREARRLLDLLRASLEVEAAQLTVFVTLRSDFLETFQHVNAVLGLDFETLSLGPMPVEGMRRVIEAPARLGAIELEPGLADRLLDDANTPDALPLLSFTLWLLWRDCHEAGVLTLEAYRKLGGLDGAVAGEADAILAIARKNGREADLRAAFLQMVRLSEDGQFVRQPVPWDTPELVPVQDLLEDFVRRRLLVSRADEGAPVVEVAHEALFRTWRPLRQWLEEHRAELVLKQQLRQSSAAWKESGRRSDYLWGGARLAEAVVQLEQGALAGGATEDRIGRSFVQASEALRKRQSRRRRNLVLLVTALLLGFLGYALLNEHEAKQAQRASWAREQSLRAIGTLETDPLQSIAMAQAAVCVTQFYDGKVLHDAHSALNRAVQGVKRQRILRGHDSAVTQVFFLPDPPAGPGQDAGPGAASQRLATLGRDDALMLWRVPSGAAPNCMGVSAPERLSGDVADIVVDAGGHGLLAVGSGGAVTRHDLTVAAAPGSDFPAINAAGVPTAMAVAPDGSRAAVAGMDGTVRVAPLPGAGPEAATVDLLHAGARIVALAFNEDGSRLATGGWDGVVRIWDTASGHLLFVFDTPEAAVTVLAIQDGKVAAAGWDETVRIWDLALGTPSQVLPHEAVISALAFVPGPSPPGILVSASWDRKTRLWDVKTGEELQALDQSAPVVSLDIAPPQDGATGLQLATGGWDGSVVLWTMAQGPREAAVKRAVAHHLEPVNDLTFSADGSRLASASDDKTVTVSRLVDQLDQHDWQSSLDLFNDGAEQGGDRWIAVITQVGVQVLEADDREKRRLVTGYHGIARQIAMGTGGVRKLSILSDEVFEYYLDTEDLMICADSLIAPSAPAADTTLSERCAEMELDPDLASIWSRVNRVFDRFD